MLMLSNPNEGKSNLSIRIPAFSDADVSLMVGGRALPQMSQEQMKEVIHSALNTFDMMEFILCRLSDIISSLNKEAVK